MVFFTARALMGEISTTGKFRSVLPVLRPSLSDDAVDWALAELLTARGRLGGISECYRGIVGGQRTVERRQSPAASGQPHRTLVLSGI